MKKILVVPDVHGREFWKVVKGFEGEVVFLGDYHDPYPYEFGDGVDYISQSLENFNEIIEFARANSNVTLLLGNHDFHYLYTSHYSVRKDYEHVDLLHYAILDNLDLFSWACKKGKVLFTHAGVCQEWLDSNPSELTDIVERINKAEPVELNQASWIRGGFDIFGSPIWMDCRELQLGRNAYAELFQVFGHTQQTQTGGIVKGETWACIDSRKVFEMDVEAGNPIETLRIFE